MKSYEMLIGNDWVGAASGATRELRDPANGELVAVVPEGGREDSARAIEAARAAFDSGPWRKVTAQDRARLLFEAAAAIKAAAAELAELEVRSCGKPLAEAQCDV